MWENQEIPESGKKLSGKIKGLEVLGIRYCTSLSQILHPKWSCQQRTSHGGRSIFGNRSWGIGYVWGWGVRPWPSSCHPFSKWPFKNLYHRPEPHNTVHKSAKSTTMHDFKNRENMVPLTIAYSWYFLQRGKANTKPVIVNHSLMY